MKEPKIKQGVVSIAVFSLLVSFFAFLFVSGLAEYYLIKAFWYYGLFAGFLAFVICFNILRPKEHEATPNVQNRLAIIGIIQEREKIIDGKITGREIVRLDTYPRYVNLTDDLLSIKGSNKNIAIIGMAGSGKTQLTYFIIESMKQYHKVIFQYKNSDQYRALGQYYFPASSL